eukprot:Em0021g917a
MLAVLPCETENWVECKGLFTLLSEQKTLEGLTALVQAHAGKQGLLAYSLGCLEGLCAFLKHHCNEDERTTFFARTFPCIVRTAARLEERAPSTGIPFITQQEAASIVLRRSLIASLLANALLCTFSSGHLVDAGIVPFNFDKFLAVFVSNPQLARQQAAKLKCVLSYFDRLFELGGSLAGIVTLRRQVIAYEDVPSLPAWTLCEQPLCPVLVDRTHDIVDAPFDTLQVDFSSSNMGGGLLESGCLQEEVRLCVSPELLVSVMVMDHMEANEAVIITGTERFSECHGSGESLEYVGPYRDLAMRDTSGTPLTSIVAIDATPFTWNPDQQYNDHHVLRELNKAYAGFVCQQLARDSADAECSTIPTLGAKPGPLVPPDTTPQGEDAWGDNPLGGSECGIALPQRAGGVTMDPTVQLPTTVVVDGLGPAECGGAVCASDDLTVGTGTTGGYSGGSVARSAPPTWGGPSAGTQQSEPSGYKAPSKGSADVRSLAGTGTELMNPLLLGAQGLRTSYAWSVASTFDEASRPVSPSELSKIAFSLVSSVEEYAAVLAESIVSEAISSLVGSCVVTSMLEEKNHLEARADEATPTSPSKIDAFLETLGSAEPVPSQSDRISTYSMRWQGVALRPVATGNWGCGAAWGGDAQLKALIQWMAVSASGRPAMMYFTDQDQDLEQFPGIVSKLLVKKWTVGQLCQFILDYTSGYQQGKRDSTVFTWLADQ